MSSPDSGEGLFAELARLVEAGRAFVLATVVASKGSTPQKPGSKMVVLEDGELRGTVGGGAVEQQIIDAALALLRDETAQTRTIETHLTHDLGMCCGGAMSVFLEKHAAVARLWLFGAGHVAKELAALAAHVGFRVTVVDERATWATAERFPTATISTLPPQEVAKGLPGGSDCYFCVATHDHPLDQACVEALLRTPRAYLGVIGSERKAERFRARLRAAGFTDAEVAQFESPMGVDIDALTPGEIAVSVVARLVAVRRRKGR